MAEIEMVAASVDGPAIRLPIPDDRPGGRAILPLGPRVR